jgi:hypothetical protein
MHCARGHAEQCLGAQDHPTIVLTVDHIVEFVDLWAHLEHVQLIAEVEDDITWKFLPSGGYSMGSAYKAQILVSTLTTMNN